MTYIARMTGNYIRREFVRSSRSTILYQLNYLKYKIGKNLPINQKIAYITVMSEEEYSNELARTLASCLAVYEDRLVVDHTDQDALTQIHGIACIYQYLGLGGVLGDGFEEAFKRQFSIEHDHFVEERRADVEANKAARQNFPKPDGTS